MTRAPATAKINLALIVGPKRPDGKHEVATVLQRVDLADRISLEPAPELTVRGFGRDTLVTRALAALAKEAGVEPGWSVRIDKKIPVAAGLGGGSSDAATALRLANETLESPLPPTALHELARELGSDVPFFLTQGPQLGEGDGSELTPLDLPQDYYVVVAVPRLATKESTGAVYAQLDERGGTKRFSPRRDQLRRTVARVRRPRELGALPPNDLATGQMGAGSSPATDELRRLGAFRADVSGAGRAVYGLFMRRDEAARARAALGRHNRVWLTVPAWYG